MITLIIKNNNLGEVDGPRKELMRLFKEYSINHPNKFFLARHMPRGWDGKINYIKENGTFSVGLLEHIGKTCDKLKIKWDVCDFRTEVPKAKKVTQWGDWKMRDYQEAAVKSVVTNKVKGVRWPRSVIKVATNGGKCVGLNTLINTGWGLVKAGELKDLNRIPVINHKLNKTHTSNFIDSGVIDTLIIETHQGYSIEVGECNHRFWNGTQWVYAKEHTVGDYIKIPKGLNVWGSNITAGNIKLTPEICYLLGVIHGDGCVKNGGRGFSATVHKDCEQIIPIIKEAISQLGMGGLVVNPHPKLKDCWKISKSGPQLFELLSHNPELINKSYRKEIPHTIRTAPKELVIHYLRGWFDTDGSSSQRGISISSVCRVGIDQLQQVLLNMGIVSIRDIKKTKIGDKRSITHRIKIQDYNRNLFMQEIGFTIDYKIREYPPFSNKTSDNIPDFLRDEVRGIKAIKPYAHTHIPISRYLRRGDKLSRDLVGRFVLAMSKYGARPSQDLIEWIEGKYIYDNIKSITKSKAHCYDFEVPEGNSYIGNGFINHNTTISSFIYLCYNLPTVFLMNSKELFDQALEEIPRIIQQPVGQISSKKIEWAPFMICMVATTRNRVKDRKVLQELSKYKCLIVDECDLANNKTNKKVIESLYNTQVRVGLSGTTHVSTKFKKDLHKNLPLEGFFGGLTYDISNRKLIDKGVSSEVEVTIIPGNDLTTLKGEMGWQDEYEEYIVHNLKRNKKVVKRSILHWGKGRTNQLIIAQRHKHIEKLVKLFNKAIKAGAYPVKPKVDWVHHSRPDRKEVVERFKQGKIDILIGSMILKRGKNFPKMKYMMNAGAGKSPENTLQLLGRAFRGCKHYEDFHDLGYHLKSHSRKREIYYKNEKLTVLKKY